MANIDRAFVTLGLTLCIVGMVLGLQIGATGDYKYLQTHVGIMLNGFLVSCVYGAIYRIWPAMKDSALAKVQFWTAFIGIIVLIAGAVALANQMGIEVILVGSLLTLAAAILILWIFSTKSGAAT